MSYPAIQPYETGMLKVSDLHTLYWEVSGKEDGKPVVFLHGGPGGGTGEKDRQYFDPKAYKIVLFDQRGAGKSTPSASLEENTTRDLVSDIEKLREHLKIDKWVVFGGSWGSALSLAYAQTYPERVKALILRGIFTLRKSELKFLTQDGTSHIFPEAWDEYLKQIPEEDHGDLMAAYHKRLTSKDNQIRTETAKAWSKWVMATSKIRVDSKDIARAAQDDWALALARISFHYFVNGGFMREGQLLEKQRIDTIRHIPTVIIQGRYDVVCPARSAYDFKKVFPEAELTIVPDAGHSPWEIPTSKLLTEVRRLRHCAVFVV
ncbi:hypothetical protein M407DRAFT_64357 [Tulasnella calospora MUT 4182]|uniref:Proline iminopeptidase n=1 Tax=Tulasnella calospora MUT 4182 TaxID=1051891 RepID=A0A0C3QYE4_9AGAM|nr:hypothetical protein M407DRAFT_64357 [Tulasnella calospora MUT 4182]